MLEDREARVTQEGGTRRMNSRGISLEGSAEMFKGLLKHGNKKPGDLQVTGLLVRGPTSSSMGGEL